MGLRSSSQLLGELAPTFREFSGGGKFDDMGTEEVFRRQVVEQVIGEDHKYYRTISIAERPLNTCRRLKKNCSGPSFHMVVPTREKNAKLFFASVSFFTELDGRLLLTHGVINFKTLLIRTNKCS